MNLPDNLFSTAFRKQRLGFMLSLLIGIMVYLGSMAMAAQAVLARTSFAWGHDIQSRMTVELLATASETSDELEGRAQKTLVFLQGIPSITSAKLLPASDTARLLQPWIDDEQLLSALALPRLLDVESVSGQSLTADALREKLKPVVGDVRVHRHEQGMSQLLGFLKGLGALAALMLGLTGLAVIMIIGIICRAAMAVQRDTIELLHYMGATDAAIARHFQKHIRRLALPSALTGFGFALVTVGGLAVLLGSLGGLSLVSPVSWMTVCGVMALVPAAAALLAVLTARLSVQSLLGRLL